MMAGKPTYTLIELVVVVIIIAVIASLGITGFNRARERTLLRQAIVELRMIRDAEQAYLLKRSTFTTCLNASQCETFLGLAFSDTARLSSGIGTPVFAWSYNVTGAPPYCAYAVRSGGSYAGCTYRFCLNGSTSDPVYFSGSCP